MPPPFGGVGLTADGSRSALRRRLAGFQLPRYVRFAGEPPKTAAGQISQTSLRADYGQDKKTEENQMSSKTTTTLAELPALKGRVLGVSEWFEVTQDRVNTFADATDDHQWIHVDPERATAESPFGGPIGHGFLTLSLFIPMWSQVLEVTDVKMAVNYGLNKVRFPAPVPVGSKIRLTATLVDVEEVKGGLQLTVGGVIEREGADKPVCVLESLARFYG